MKIDGIPKDRFWRVIKLGPKGWRTWLLAVGNVDENGVGTFEGVGNPLCPKTDRQEAEYILHCVTCEWPGKTWAIIDPEHNFVVKHEGQA